MAKKDYEFDPYKVDKLSAIPPWLKILALKYWAAGVTCYLVFMGLNLFFADFLDRAAAFCIVFALINDWIVNTIIRMMSSPKSNTEVFSFVTGISVVSLILNIIYSVVCYVAMFSLAYGLSLILPFNIYFEEPFVFGLFYIIVDGMFLVIKYYVTKLLKHIQSNKKQKEL